MRSLWGFVLFSLSLASAVELPVAEPLVTAAPRVPDLDRRAGSDNDIFGYYLSNGKVRTYSCPGNGVRTTGATFDGNGNTYARCDVADENGALVMVTTCVENTIYWVTSVTGSTDSGSRDCSSFGCATMTLFQSSGDNQSQLWIDCKDILSPMPQQASTFYIESDNITSDVPSTATHAAHATKGSSSTATQTGKSTNTDGADGGKGGGGGGSKLSGGAIAGIVVGSIVGVGLIAGAVVVAFLVGRKNARARGGEDGRVNGDIDDKSQPFIGSPAPATATSPTQGLAELPSQQHVDQYELDTRPSRP